MTRTVVVCADIGSTYTKVAVVDLGTATLVATTSTPTTVDSDVLIGLDTAISVLGARLPGADLNTVLACSSAGGGLRLAVVGYEALVSAEAGHRVALTAGARVVHVATGRLDGVAVAAVWATQPDIVLLVGGTDGGDAEVLRHNAAALATGPDVPVVVAGNIDARADAVALLETSGGGGGGARLGGRAVAVDNVLPRIGEVRPGPARAAIREAFLRHVIGGGRLSPGPRLRSVVRCATPDAVLGAVEVLATVAGRDLLVVDVGGATTDVYSATGASLRSAASGASLRSAATDSSGPTGGSAAVAGTLPVARTVEGDLGVGVGAAGVLAAAQAERLITEQTAAKLETAELNTAAAVAGRELRLAELAIIVALRRHARTGRDLRGLRLVIGSGGVLRHADPELAGAVLDRVLGDTAGGWALPRAPDRVVDRAYVLAPAGLLAAEHPEVAARILRRYLCGG